MPWVFLLLVLVVCPRAWCGETGGMIVLDGTHKFAVGDKPEWASPSFDDSLWKPVKVPGGLQLQGLGPERYMAWYRIHFTAPSYLASNDPAVYLGRIGDADEVFINGVKIGGEGAIGDRFVEAVRARRLYHIPPELLQVDGDNILAVRVLNVYTSGGILDSPLALGPYNELLLIKRENEAERKGVEIALLSFLLLFMIIYVLFYLRGARDREYVYFGMLIFFFTVVYGLDISSGIGRAG